MENHILKTWRNPYDEGFSTCRPKQIELHSGLTVLVGCNGAGKTTLLKNIESELKKENIPVFSFDNNSDGQHSNTFGKAMMQDNFAFIATAMSSSEGENITINLSQFVPHIRQFLQIGKTPEQIKEEKWAEAFSDEPFTPSKITSNERWILLDALDSGYSIDNVIDLKILLKLIITESQSLNLDTYIIISANEYELANEEQCFDVMNGQYITFRDYNDFKQFILKTRSEKDKRNK